MSDLLLMPNMTICLYLLQAAVYVLAAIRAKHAGLTHCYLSSAFLHVLLALSSFAG
jgi:hypothetical protein